MKKIINIIIILLTAIPAFAGRNVRIYKSIEFRNINYLSKYEIMSRADIDIKGDNIYLDINSLDGILNNSPMVKSFKLTEAKGTLYINIIENEPIFLLVGRSDGENKLIELDNEFHVVSVNRIHVRDIPPLMVAMEDIKDNLISPRIKSLLRLYSNLRAAGLDVMREISEMDFTDTMGLRVILKGRKTIFTIKPDAEGFTKMNYAAGYLDKIRYYPRSFTILNGMGVLE